MDQRLSTTDTAPITAGSIEAELGLDRKGRSRRWRFWLYVLIVLALLGGAVAYYMRSASTSNTVTFVTAPAETGRLTVEVTATGTLQPLTQVDISSELSGIVRSVAVDENQYVKQGDVLAELDTTRLLAEIDRAKASVKAADAKVADAHTTLTETNAAQVRAAQLTNRGMATEQALEAATAARDRAQAALDAAEANAAIAAAELKLQEADLQKSTIYAPIDGIVLTRSVDPGQTVASSLQAPVLFVIAADLRKMELNAAVDEADIGGVRAGQKARFSVDAFPGRTFDADIRDIAYASVTTDGVVTYDARLEVDNEELLLRPGMTATVEIVTREADNVLTVPSAAFRFRPPVVEESRGWSLEQLFRPPLSRRSRDTRPQRTDGSRPLYILKDGQPQLVYVTPGATDAERTEIVSGLSAGDPVITAIATNTQRTGQ
ncbi:MAG: efflux RND transporter periplasmic adaptor subunit [Rhizobiaceae bacterium]|nr:efflux RND transporter periplasmic adaptor subunit [Rhizobiaceae bacterium]